MSDLDLNDTLEEQLRHMLVDKNNECNGLKAQIKMLEESVAQEQEAKYRAYVKIDLVLAMGKVMMNPMAPGLGLSANQVGIQKNVIIMGTDERLIACINPSVDELIGDKEIYLEGCLSFPDLWLHVKRHPECIVTYQTVDGELVEKKHMKGLEARVFLHEYDHLLGVTFDERVTSALSLELAKKRRAKKQRLTAKLIKKASKLSSLK